jgi:hypothetical protein
MRKILSIAIAGLFIACTQTKPIEGKPAVLNAGLEVEVTGETWISACKDNYRTRYIFGDGVIALYSDLYTNADCSGTITMTTYSIATLVLGDMSDVVEGAQNIDVTAQEIGIIPRTQETADGLAAHESCAGLSFSVNARTSLSGSSCILGKPWPEVPAATKYTIMLKTSTELYMGEAAILCFTTPCYGGQSAELRIRDLDEKLFSPMN